MHKKPVWLCTLPAWKGVRTETIVHHCHCRLRILSALAQHEMCVCDISALLQMTQSAISHQLKSLRLSNLVVSRKEGKIVYYQLADEHVALLLEQGILHAQHS